MTELRPEHFEEIQTTLEGWPAGIITYKLGDRWLCRIHNVSPGATIARADGATREEARAAAVATASTRLARTRRLRTAVEDLRESVAQLSSALDAGKRGQDD